MSCQHGITMYMCLVSAGGPVNGSIVCELAMTWIRHLFFLLQQCRGATAQPRGEEAHAAGAGGAHAPQTGRARNLATPSSALEAHPHHDPRCASHWRCSPVSDLLQMSTMRAPSAECHARRALVLCSTFSCSWLLLIDGRLNYQWQGCQLSNTVRVRSSAISSIYVFLLHEVVFLSLNGLSGIFSSIGVATVAA